MTATHTHSVPGQTGPDYIRKIVESVQRARDRLTPARVGYGSGVSYINVNRNIIDPKTRRWWEGPNYDGPSDRTVAVMKVESLTSEPIAVYYNYAMHAVTVGQLDLVSADAPGTTSKYIEHSLDDKVVALWSSGAAGDQNPIYFQQTFDVRDIRIKDYAKRGIDISNAMPAGGQGLNKKDPQVIKLMDQQKQMIVSMGQFLGEEVLHVMRGMERTDSEVEIYGGVKTVSCPGRSRTNEGRAGIEGTYKDAEPVEIKLGLLRIGDIAIGAVNAEVFNSIAQKLKKLVRVRGSQATQLTFRESLGEMGRRWQSLIGISIGAIFQAVPTYALISWTPTFFQRAHRWTPGQSGRGLALLLLTFGCLGMYVGGRLSDYWQKKGIVEGPLRVGVVCGVGALLLLPVAYLLPQDPWTMALLAPGIFFLAFPMGTSPAALQRIFPNQVRGQVSALLLFFLNLGGLSLGPLMPGLLNDRLFHDENMLGASLAITIGVASVLMLIAFRATYSAYRAHDRLMPA